MLLSHRTTPFFAVTAVSLAVYWRTAYPSITWWDSGNYSLAAHTLGITSPPGSLLLNLIGWPVSHLPLGMTPARVLNLFAGVLAALTVALVIATGLRMARVSAAVERDLRPAAVVAAAGGALAFAFTTTLWEHAIKFNPYVLTALFTALILWTMLRWWEVADDAHGWRWLLLLGVLFGLDFSVHRTNALLIPGAIAWIAIRRPRTMASPRAVTAGVAGMLSGLAVHLLLIPIARFSESPVKMYDTSTFARFWSYVSLEPLGGNFLLNLWPRKSDFWSVQATDFVRIFADNFIHRGSFLSGLSAAAIVAGLVALFRRSRAMGAAWLLALSMQIALTVIYFNIPADYFRPFDRHYLPIFVMCGVTMAFGLAAVAQRLTERRSRTRMAFVAAAVALPVGGQLFGNWRAHDASRRHFTADYARNALASLPLNAIYFTVGDNDNFPAMYMRHAEGVRPDVEVVSLSLAGLPWYREQILRRDPEFPVSVALDARLAPLGIATRSRLVVPVAGTADSVVLQTRPAYGTTFLASDSALIDIVHTNQWRRPIVFAGTAGDLGWLHTHARRDGLHNVILPRPGAGTDSSLRANLLQAYEYRGYADSSVYIDPDTRSMSFQYWVAFADLIEADRLHGRDGKCRETLAAYLRLFPPERLKFGVEFEGNVRHRCG